MVERVFFWTGDVLNMCPQACVINTECKHRGRLSRGHAYSFERLQVFSVNGPGGFWGLWQVDGHQLLIIMIIWWDAMRILSFHKLTAKVSEMAVCAIAFNLKAPTNNCSILQTIGCKSIYVMKLAFRQKWLQLACNINALNMSAVPTGEQLTALKSH